MFDLSDVIADNIEDDIQPLLQKLKLEKVETPRLELTQINQRPN